MDNYKKTGYLNNDFKIFHLINTEPREFNYHYHDFHKVLIFISGNASYHIEGKTYELKPYDIVLISAGEIHKPVLHDATSYERIIIYISSDFFNDYKKDDYDLSYCFTQAFKNHSNLLRMEDISKTKLYTTSLELKHSFHKEDYANTLYQKVVFIEFMIWLNRAVINEDVHYMEALIYNKTILEIINFVNLHIYEDLTIDSISAHLFLNRSYIMHLFKSQTGYTIGKYISEKRLFISKKLIQNGMSVTDACYHCGFKNYTTFFRAFKDKFKISPKDASDIP